MAVDITTLLIKSLFGLYMVVLTIRMLLRLHDADYYNPVTQQLVRLSDVVVRPFNNVLPVIASLELGTFLATVLFSALTTFLLGAVESTSVSVAQLLPWALIGLAYMVCDIYFFAILAMVVLSWVAPHSNHPIASIAYQLAEPIGAPFRRVIPSMGGLDLSPIFAILAINIVQIILRSWAQSLGLPISIVPGI